MLEYQTWPLFFVAFGEEPDHGGPRLGLIYFSFSQIICDRLRVFWGVLFTCNQKFLESVKYMYYWPPEKFQSGIEQTDYKADIWALGLTLCELVFGVIPFLYENNYPCIKDISDLSYKLKTLDVDKLIMEIFSVNYFSDNLREFVRLCLLPVDKRPRYNVLIKTAFHRQYESFGDEDKVSTCLHDIELKIGRSL
jgi:serine/threonine protein kinase